MKKVVRNILVSLLLASGAPCALGQLRVAQWNITNYSTGRINEFQTAIYGVVPATLPGGGPYLNAGKSMSPDVIVVQEISSNAALVNFRNILNTAPGSPGDWQQVTFVVSTDSEGSMFYRSSKVQLVQDTTVISVGANDSDGLPPHLPPRDTQRWIVRLVGYPDSPATRIALYSSHMKSGSGADELRRATEGQRIATNVNGLSTETVAGLKPAAANAILGGDFNTPSSNDEGYKALVGPNPSVPTGPLFDPIMSPGTWSGNSSSTFRMLYTQDPANITSLPNAQMDDRFDFLMLNAALRNGTGLDYIGSLTTPWNLNTFADPNHSYRSWGVDGQSVNAPMRITDNLAVGPTIALALANSAPNGGHLPVFLDLRVPAKIGLSTLDIDFGSVPINSVQARTFTVSNTGDVALWTASGIASLTYTMPTAAAPFSITPSGTLSDAAGGGVNTHTVSLNTSAPGAVVRTITIPNGSVDTPSVVVTLRGTVVGVAACGPSDVAGPGQSVGSDGSLTADDIIVFLNWFFAGNTRADVAGPGQSTTPDTHFTADDIIVFLNRFFAGC